MKISVGKIRSGLMQLKRLMGGSSSKSAMSVQAVHHTTMYSNIAARPAELYMNQVVASYKPSLAPPPSGLPSLASTLASSQGSVESDIQQYMDAVTTEEESVEEPSGLLGVIRDLQVYEDFVRSEMEISEDPSDPEGLRGLQGGVIGLNATQVLMWQEF